MHIEFRKNFRLVTVFLLLYTTVYSQKNFKDGYVVLKSGDTLHGQIDYQNWEVNPLKIRFQQGTSITTYKPENLNSFEITGEDSYFTKIVTKDMRPVDVIKVSIAQDNRDTSITDTAFLRILVNGGRLKLYGLTDSKEHYYIQGNDGKIEELLYKRYQVGNGLNVDERSIYKNQLTGFLEGVNPPKELLNKIESSHYEEKDLVLIVRLLNGEDLVSIKSEPKKKSPLHLLVGGGVEYFTFRFSGNVEKYNQLKFTNNIGPIANIAIDVYGTRNLHKFAIRLELSYSHLSYKGKFQKNDFYSHPTQYSYNFTQNNFMPGVDILNNFINKKNFKLYGGLGMAFVLSSYPVNEYRTKVIATGVEELRTNDALDPENFWISPNVMLGVKIRDKINLNALTKISGGFFDYTQIHGAFFPVVLTASYIISGK